MDPRFVRVDIYPADPRPSIVLWRDCVEIYPYVPRPSNEDIVCCVNALVVLWRDRDDTYPYVPKPMIVLCTDGDEI